jgi:ATP-binding cassette, subfamily B, bacterial PglK
VGHTGSGKTTLVNVLLGLLEPTAGSVEVDGARSRRTAARYRRLFGYVPQDIFLVDDSIRRNVALGIPDDEIDDEAVRLACRPGAGGRLHRARARRTATTRSSASAACASRADSANASASPGRCTTSPPCWCSTRPPARSTCTPRSAVFEALDAIARERTLVMIAHRLETVAWTPVPRPMSSADRQVVAR